MALGTLSSFASCCLSLGRPRISIQDHGGLSQVKLKEHPPPILTRELSCVVTDNM